MTSAVLTVTLLSFASGCSAAPTTESEEASLASEAALSAAFELFPAGFFEESTTGFVPRLVHSGFVRADGTWVFVKDTPIAFDGRRSAAVSLEIPAEHAGLPLAYTVLRVSSSGSERWDPVEELDSKRPEGEWVTLPIASSGGYPFSPQCFGIRVGDIREHDATATATTLEWVRFAGASKVESVFVGFTAAATGEYLQNNDVPWEDRFGRAQADRALNASYAHDGGYKGSYVLAPLRVRVPKDRNLVFKLRITKHGGVCGVDNTTRFEGTAETKTFFVPVRDR
jgi:hypothetical protein